MREVREPGIIVFLHLPKTAGSSVRHLLREQFEPRQVLEANPSTPEFRAAMRRYVEGESDERPRRKKSANDIVESELRAMPPDRVARLGLVMGHVRYGVHEVLPRPAHYVTLLRDPVERVLSLYAARVRQVGLTVDLDRWVRTGRDPVLDNNQVSLLAGVRRMELRGAPVSMEELDLAKAHLREFAVVGVTERFDEFLALLSRTFGWSALRSVEVNRSASRLRAADVDPSLVEAIRERNRLDQDLYDHALELIATRAADQQPGIDAEVRRIRAHTAWRSIPARLGRAFRIDRTTREP